MNGSFTTGRCLSLHIDDKGMPICLDPTSSVLFDGDTPTLTGLDGNLWARKLYTSRSVITFDFSETTGYNGVTLIEIVVLNCEQLGASVSAITLSNLEMDIATVNVTLASCDSYVQVCIDNLLINCTEKSLSLTFSPLNPDDWVHIAEITFREKDRDCPLNVIVDPFTFTEASLSPTTHTMEG